MKTKKNVKTDGLFRTARSIEKERTESKIHSEYMELTAVPGRSKVEIIKFLCKKYGVSLGTFYKIIRRVEARMKQTV